MLMRLTLTFSLKQWLWEQKTNPDAGGSPTDSTLPNVPTTFIRQNVSAVCLRKKQRSLKTEVPAGIL